MFVVRRSSNRLTLDFPIPTAVLSVDQAPCVITQVEPGILLVTMVSFAVCFELDLKKCQT